MSDEQAAGNVSGNKSFARAKVVQWVEACLTSTSASDEAELVVDVMLGECSHELRLLLS